MRSALPRSDSLSHASSLGACYPSKQSRPRIAYLVPSTCPQGQRLTSLHNRQLCPTYIAAAAPAGSNAACQKGDSEHSVTHAQHSASEPSEARTLLESAASWQDIQHALTLAIHEAEDARAAQGSGPNASDHEMLPSMPDINCRFLAKAASRLWKLVGTGQERMVLKERMAVRRLVRELAEVCR